MMLFYKSRNPTKPSSDILLYQTNIKNAVFLYQTEKRRYQLFNGHDSRGVPDVIKHISHRPVIMFQKAYL